MYQAPNISTTKIDTPISVPPKTTNSCHQPKINSVCFEEPYEQINPMDNKNDNTHLIDSHE